MWDCDPFGYTWRFQWLWLSKEWIENGFMYHENCTLRWGLKSIQLYPFTIGGESLGDRHTSAKTGDKIPYAVS